jgi:hypothetical protein
MAPPMDALTADGYDLTFGINVLGEMIPTSQLSSYLSSYSRPLLFHSTSATYTDRDRQNLTRQQGSHHQHVLVIPSLPQNEP